MGTCWADFAALFSGLEADVGVRFSSFEASLSVNVGANEVVSMLSSCYLGIFPQPSTFVTLASIFNSLIVSFIIYILLAQKIIVK